MDKQMIARELVAVAELLSGDRKRKTAGRGDPWSERDRVMKRIQRVAADVGEIWFSEDAYHFDDPKYAKKVDAGLDKLFKVADDLEKKVKPILKGFSL